MVEDEETSTVVNENEENVEPVNEAPKKSMLNKKQLIYISAGIVTLLICIGILLSPLPTMVKSFLFQKNNRADLLELAFLPIPEMIVNLKSTKSHGNILKAVFVLEIGTIQEKEEIEHLKPLIMDQFQSYLRELEISDVEGGAGIERVRQELFNRVNAIIAPLKVRQVLIKDFLVQ